MHILNIEYQHNQDEGREVTRDCVILMVTNCENCGSDDLTVIKCVKCGSEEFREQKVRRISYAPTFPNLSGCSYEYVCERCGNMLPILPPKPL